MNKTFDDRGEAYAERTGWDKRDSKSEKLMNLSYNDWKLIFEELPAY